MRRDEKDIPHSATSEVLVVCDAYHAWNAIRIDLDQRLMTLPGGDDRREILWQELEAAVARLFSLAAKLATVPSRQPVAIQAKAIVLALLLRFCNGQPSAIGAETTALALSLADEVAAMAA